MRLHWFQHVPFEGLGAIESWVQKKNFNISVTRFWKGEIPPPAQNFDFLIVMGGSMNIYEEEKFPWLAVEKKALREAVRLDKKIIGICLGAQLLADVLGGKVSKNPYKEIGWFPVRFTEFAQKHSLFKGLPQELLAFHWHGDTFEIPKEADLLCQSAACKNQAFLYKEQVLGLQFHLETTSESALALIENCGQELAAGPFIQHRDVLLENPEMFQRMHFWLFALLDNFIKKESARSCAG